MNSKVIKLIIVFIYLFFIKIFAQSEMCSLYIYSEFDNYKVYIDDIFKGSNLKKIDSITCTEHYIKIMYEDVNVFSEILNFKSNEVKKILIKKTKEIEEKFLATKTKEIQEYRRRKISIGVNKKYITTTEVALNKYDFKPLFGNYYGLNYSGNISGVQFSESEEKITDWFFIEGGYIKLDDETFLKNYCNLTNNCSMYNQTQEDKKKVDEYNKNISKINKKRNTLIGIFAFFWTIGVLSFVWGFIEVLVPMFLDADMAMNLFVGGLIISVAFLFPLVGIRLKSYQSYREKWVDLKDALKLIDEYNSALKKQLNLPENID